MILSYTLSTPFFPFIRSEFVFTSHQYIHKRNASRVTWATH